MVERDDLAGLDGIPGIEIVAGDESVDGDEAASRDLYIRAHMAAASREGALEALTFCSLRVATTAMGLIKVLAEKVDISDGDGEILRRESDRLRESIVSIYVSSVPRILGASEMAEDYKAMFGAERYESAVREITKGVEAWMIRGLDASPTPDTLGKMFDAETFTPPG